MKKGLKQGWIAVLLFVFMLTALFVPNKNVYADTAKQKAGNVIIDVERFTIGQGFYKEPEQVPFYKGETVKDLLERFIGTDKMMMDGDYYLKGIKGADLGIDNVKVPDYISNSKIKGPTTEEAKERGKSGEANDLEEFDYAPGAGWMYFANNVDSNLGINEYKLKDGDVIRLQFTLTIGCDLTGIDHATGKPLCDSISNKDEALKEIGRINSSEYKAELLAKEEVKNSYDHLKKSVQNAIISQEVLDQEVKTLKAVADPVLASKVSGQIQNLDENVDLTQEEEVTRIKDAFDRLLDAQQYISSEEKTKLSNAVEKIQSLKDTEAAGKVISKINGLAQIKIDLSKENQVKEVRNDYEMLTSDQKKLVTNLSVLEDAEQTIAKLKKQTPSNASTSPRPAPSKPSVSSIKAGTTVKTSTGKEYVKVTSVPNKTVEYVKPSKKTYKTVSVPATVKISGVTYKVTSISANAFKGMKKLQKVTVGGNVEKIGNKVFAGCQKLNSIIIISKKLSAKTVSSKAFAGTKKKITVKVPKNKYKAYKKFLTKKGNKTIKIAK